MKQEKCIILGKTGSGKDYLSNELSKLGLKKALKSTTRPLRVGEKIGVEYNFINDLEFDKLSKEGKFLTEQTFKVYDESGSEFIWKYGLEYDEFFNSNLVILTPYELSEILPKLKKEVRKNLFIVYLDIDRDVRESRVNIRQNNIDSIKRRMDADELDFEEFSNSSLYDLRVRDPEFNAQDIYGILS